MVQSTVGKVLLHTGTGLFNSVLLPSACVKASSMGGVMQTRMMRKFIQAFLTSPSYSPFHLNVSYSCFRLQMDCTELTWSAEW